jgi:hypothetical protein
MRLTAVLVLAAAGSIAARADFSYTTVSKGAGMMAAASGQTSKNFFKGDKMMVDRGNAATIIDFGSQTITHINHTQKTYSVMPFGEIGAKMGQAGGMDVKVDVKETGQRKVIGGFNCREVILTMEAEGPPAARQPGGAMKMGVTMDMWVSPDVPGHQEMHAFGQRMASGPGWAAMMGGGPGGAGGNTGMQKAMAELQKKMANLNGVPVLVVMKIGAAGDAAQAAQMQQGMAQARAQLEAKLKNGSEQEKKMAEAMLSRMGGGSSGSTMEMTMESSGFSTATIPASQFAPPAGYRKADAK